MKDERGKKELAENGDDACVAAGEINDFTLARVENSAMMTMLQAIMTKMDRR